MSTTTQRAEEQAPPASAAPPGTAMPTTARQDPPATTPAAAAARPGTRRAAPRLLRLGSRVALPVSPRNLTVAAVLGALILICGLVTLSAGSLGVAPAEAVAALAGEADGKVEFVLERLRGPRLLVAVGVGLALGLSGSLFQTVTRNPLGSPDVLGLGAGAGAGVAMTTLLGSGMVPAPIGAVVGAGIAILLVWWSSGVGFASPARVIVTGIGVASMATALTHYVVAVALHDAAHDLAAYTMGSLGTRSMEHAALIGVALAVLLPALVLLAHRLRPMDLGDELADTLGSGAASTRTAAIVLAVLLAAAAVAVAGPISFVALTAPHIARRLTRAPGPNLAVSALVGAMILVSADLAAQQLPFLDGLPVGIVTAGVGGVYLGHLLIVEWRRASA
ncbi:FecCD family ABC transporter permease [Nesterenkonia halobia]|uniref:Iron chelate uptake ABC transporter family permease subunit n=1 Tax=Nesterenkonia halobia TaxID=37922 RepID=A0ABP6RFD8_9MICC